MICDFKKRVSIMDKIMMNYSPPAITPKVVRNLKKLIA